MADQAPQDAEREAMVAKLRSERDKLDADRRVAEHQLSGSYRRREDWKAWAGVGGIVTGVAATIALLLSAYQWNAQQSAQRTSEVSQRYQEALVLSGDSIPSKRLSGIMLLGSFVSDDYYQERALLALSNVLALEDNATVRGAIVEAFKTIEAPSVRRTATLDRVLTSLVEKSRVWSADRSLYGTLDRSGQVVGSRAASRDNTVARAKSIGDAITTVLTKGGTTKDLSGLFCAGCTFPKRSYADTKFDRAVLYDARFIGASLRNASFVGADVANADFRMADLTNAKFDTSSYWLDRFDPRAMREELYLGSAFVANLPRFECADLQGASFKRFPILLVAHLDGRSEIEPLNLRGANLTNTDFRDAAVLRVYSKKEARTFLQMIELFGILLMSEGVAEVHRYDAYANESAGDGDEITDVLGRAMENSNWSRAQLPSDARRRLNRKQPVGARQRRCTAPAVTP